MKITSKNFPDLLPAIRHTGFYKATASGVQECRVVESIVSSVKYSETASDWGPPREPISGYVSDSLFHRIRYGGVDYVPLYSDISHFDGTQQGFFTTEDEAIAFHRELVINYIRGLNASSLKTCPITIE